MGISSLVAASSCPSLFSSLKLKKRMPLSMERRLVLPLPLEQRHAPPLFYMKKERVAACKAKAADEDMKDDEDVKDDEEPIAKSKLQGFVKIASVFLTNALPPSIWVLILFYNLVVSVPPSFIRTTIRATIKHHIYELYEAIWARILFWKKVKKPIHPEIFTREWLLAQIQEDYKRFHDIVEKHCPKLLIKVFGELNSHILAVWIIRTVICVVPVNLAGWVFFGFVKLAGWLFFSFMKLVGWLFFGFMKFLTKFCKGRKDEKTE